MALPAPVVPPTKVKIAEQRGPSKEELEKVGEAAEGLPSIGGPCGPYIQSLRLPRYKEVAETLVETGFAYRCDCTPEMLERERNEQMARKELPGYSGYCRDRNVSADNPHVVRLKMPYKKTIVLNDAVKGRVVWDDASLRDTVLLKSDGFPTYHLAVVVDDHDMRISHVLRGDEWLASAPIHLLVYEALGWTPPVFAHLPVILGPSGKKLSKREGSVFTSIFREKGYLPEALLNYVSLIGWNPGEGETQEVFLRAFRGLPHFRGDATFRTWLVGIAINVCRNHATSASHRHRDAEVALEIRPDPEGDPVELQIPDRSPDPEAALAGKELGALWGMTYPEVEHQLAANLVRLGKRALSYASG